MKQMQDYTKGKKSNLLIKGIFLLLVFVFFSTRVSSQELELSVRFHSSANISTINLTTYLGDAKEYFFSKSDNVNITIDQGLGVAILEAKPGWTGVETIVFSVNETAYVNETRGLGGGISISPRKGIRISDEELVRLFEGSLGSNFEVLTSSIEEEELKKVLVELRGNKLSINLNEELELSIERSRHQPEIEISIILPQGSPATITFTRGDVYLKYLGLSIVLILLVLLIFGYIKSYLGYLKIKAEHEGLINTTLVRLRRLRKAIEDDKNAPLEFSDIIESFFTEFFKIRKFNYYTVTHVLDKSDISIGLKMRFGWFLEDYLQHKQDHPSKKDLKTLVDKFIKIIKRYR